MGGARFSTTSTLHEGDSGPDVVQLQTALGIDADGDFGPKTKLAVEKFQAARGLHVSGIVDAKTWAAVLAPWPPVVPSGVSSGEALVAVARQCLGVREGNVSNRGPRVDDLIRLGGFKLSTDTSLAGPPWCGWFGGACVGLCASAGLSTWSPARSRRGLAVAWWLDAPDALRVSVDDVWDHDGPGLVMVMVRQAKDRAAVLRGQQRYGHLALPALVDRETKTVHAIAGNSSGQGHAVGTGSVEKETYRAGTSRWGRVVGFVRVVDIARAA